MKIGILYNTSSEYSNEKNRIANDESYLVAKEIKDILKRNDHNVSLIRSDNNLELDEDIDLIFNLAEGIGDDSKGEALIADLMEHKSIPFTGNNSKTLSLCLNKIETKKRLEEFGISTPRFQIFNRNEEISTDMQYPLIVKPSSEDASIGISFDSIVYDEVSLKKKVNEIIDSYGEPVLVEEYIDGREINVALLGNGERMETLPISEIVFDYPKGYPKFLPYEAKWLEDSEVYNKSKGVCPADIDTGLQKEIEMIAKQCAKAMGCRDYARVDFRIRDNTPYVLEVNPNPCINPEGAGFVRSAKAAGYSYEELILTIARNAMKRNNINIRTEIIDISQ